MPASVGPLNGYRVLDLATLRGDLAGRILADLGAEVIKIEPPGGSDVRRLPPFDDANGDSLLWATVALGKRSLVLDLTSQDDRDALLRLAATADVWIESSDPGTMARLHLDYDTLSADHPGLVYASITPFGQSGPLAASPATDLTVEAAGGLVSLQGDNDRPPLPVGYPQASFHGGTQAAADIVIALHERLRSGLGQHLDVSMQAAIVWTLMNATGYPPLHQDDPPLGGRNRGDPPPEILPGIHVPPHWPCADGYCTIHLTLPLLGGRTFQTLIDWAAADAALPDEIRDANWADWIALAHSGELPTDQVLAALEIVAHHIKTKTKSEIQRFATERGIIVGAMFDAADLRADPQLAARDYWTRVGERVHPGPFAKFSETPLVLDRPAPALGEAQHLLDETPPPAPVPAANLAGRPSSNGARSFSFDGLKVADFAWVGVGPLISKGLADHGATVIHVESSTRVDVLRLVPPFRDGKAGIDRGQFMPNFNTSKLGLAINLATEPGRALARRLADWADVVVESFTPGTMAKFGLDYETLSRDRPELVMLSTCLRGQTGPEAGYAGFGGQGACLAGLQHITGWPDRIPAGAWGAYTDFVNPRFGIAALSAAIVHRQRTGQGQHVDQAQTEAGIRFMEPLILDYTVNGRVAGPAGHDSLYASPHGVYPAQGHERWVALSVETREQWHALLHHAPLDAFADPTLDDLTERMKHRAAIDAALRAWTAPQEPFDLAHGLRQAGVPASVANWPSDLYTDPQLSHREFFVTLDHSVMGPTPYDGLVTQFSATPGALRKAGPCLGEDTQHVLSDILGLSDAEIEELALAGALS